MKTSILGNSAVAVLAILIALEASACRDKSKAYLKAAHMSQALALASTAKVHVGASYEDKGQWPSSNEEAGLPPAAEYANESISGLTVSEGGVITVRFNEKSGVPDGFLRLTPDASNPEIGIRWRCSTRSFKEIATVAMPQCTAED